MFRKIARWLNWLLAALLIVGIAFLAARSEVFAILLFVGVGGGLMLAEVIKKIGLWPPSKN